MKNLCIYHRSCADGFGAALAVKLHFEQLGEECEYLPAHYGEEAPDVTGKCVVIVDFSYPRKTLITMQKQAKDIIVLDHHKTAEAELKGLEFCIFDMERSGAMMAWEHFHAPKNIPILIDYVQDRDLWQWKLPHSKEISSGLQLLPMEFAAWEEYFDTAKLPELIAKGETILAYQNQHVEAVVKREARIITLAGFAVPIVNTTTLVSEVCGRLAEDYPFAVTYFDTDKDRVYSLRSRGRGGEDVSKIAKLFGGGGHPKASGFSIPLNDKQL